MTDRSRHITATLTYDEAGLFAEHRTESERVERLMTDFKQELGKRAGEVAAAVEPWNDIADLGIVNVMRYGAVGDGKTDDTAAIQAAIAAFSSGDTLIFPPGTYKGDGATRHVIPADVSVMAYGATLDEVLFSPRARSSIRGATFTAESAFVIQSGSATYDPDVTIEDCVFDGVTRAIYDEGNNSASDNMHSGWRIRNNVFDGCDYGFLSVRCRDFLIDGNIFYDSTTRAVTFFSGKRNRVLNNTVQGGTAGVGFVMLRNTVGYSRIIEGNIVSGNTVIGYDEEGIAFDVNGSDGDTAGVIETDTVASTGTSGSNFTVTLADTGWGTHPAAVYFGYYCTFLTGALVGRSFFISDMPANTGRMVFVPADMTSAEHALIQEGDYVSIGTPQIANSITNNYVNAAGSASGHGTTNGIILFGNCFHNTISGNVVEHGNIEINSIEGIDKPTTTYTDNNPRAMSLYNVVTGNTVTRGDILFDHLGFGAFEDNPTFQSVGNVAVGNAVLNGDIIADGHTVTAIGNAATYDTSNSGSFVDGASTE